MKSDYIHTFIIRRCNPAGCVYASVIGIIAFNYPKGSMLLYGFIRYYLAGCVNGVFIRRLKNITI